jgi:hypothetical protein
MSPTSTTPMRYIDLQDGSRALVDHDVHERIGNLPWRAVRNGYSHHVYVVCSIPDPLTGHRWRLHHAVAQLGGVPGDGAWIDHKDGNPRNNLRANLRRASPIENARSRRRSPGRAYLTPYIGTSRDRHGRFIAQICHENRTWRIGTFLDLEECALARDRVARMLRGEFAVLNFPTDDGRPLRTRVDPDRSCGKRCPPPFDMAKVLQGG